MLLVLIPLFLATLHLVYIVFNKNRRTRIWGRPGNEVITITAKLSSSLFSRLFLSFDLLNSGKECGPLVGGLFMVTE